MTVQEASGEDPVDKQEIFRIPYGSPDIITSEKLNRANGVLWRPLGIFVCAPCNKAIKMALSHFMKHRRSPPHNDTTYTKDDFIALAREHIFHDLDVIEITQPQISVVPGIPFISGFRCPIQGCYDARQSKKKALEHIRLKHPLELSKQPQECTIQSIFDSNQKFYPVNIPDAVPATQSRKHHPQLIEQSYEDFYAKQREIALTVPDDNAHLSPFLQKYRWHKVIEKTSPRVIQDWLALPSDEEPKLARLSSIIKTYYQYAVEMMEDDGKVPYSLRIRRILNTKKSLSYVHFMFILLPSPDAPSSQRDINNNPLQVPMRNSTVVEYTRTIIRLVAFTLRAYAGDLVDFEHELSPTPLTSALSLLKCMESSQHSLDQCQEGLHHLLWSLLTERVGEGNNRSPVDLFMVFANVKSSGQIQELDNISHFLATLQWPLRTTGFLEVVQRLKSGEDIEE